MAKSKFGRVGLAAAIASAAAFGAVAAPSAAFAAEDVQVAVSTIDFGDGKRLANGVALEVPVTASCDAPSDWPDATAPVDLKVWQNAGGSIAHASGSVDIKCTGQPETVMITMVALGVPFGEGIAWGEARTFDFEENGGQYVEVKKEFQIS